MQFHSRRARLGRFAGFWPAKYDTPHVFHLPATQPMTGIEGLTPSPILCAAHLLVWLALELRYPLPLTIDDVGIAGCIATCSFIDLHSRSGTVREPTTSARRLAATPDGIESKEAGLAWVDRAPRARRDARGGHPLTAVADGHLRQAAKTFRLAAQSRETVQIPVPDMARRPPALTPKLSKSLRRNKKSPGGGTSRGFYLDDPEGSPTSLPVRIRKAQSISPPLSARPKRRQYTMPLLPCASTGSGGTARAAPPKRQAMICCRRFIGRRTIRRISSVSISFSDFLRSSPKIVDCGCCAESHRHGFSSAANKQSESFRPPP